MTKQPDIKQFLDGISSVDDLKRIRNGKRGPERKVLNGMIRQMKDTAWNIYFVNKNRLAQDFMDAKEKQEKTLRKKDISKAKKDVDVAFTKLMRFFSVPVRIMDYVKPNK